MNSYESIVGFFNTLRSCIEFDDEKEVSKEQMQTILEVGRLAPSSFGMEPWEFLVIENKYIMDQIYKLLSKKSWLESQGDYLVILLARRGEELEYSSDYVKHILKDVQSIPESEIYKQMDRYKYFIEEDYNVSDENGNISGWIGKQTYIALTMMVVAAHSMDINVRAIEGFRRKELEDYLIHEKLYDNEKFTISCVAAFGYGKENKYLKSKKRRPYNEVIKWIE